MTLFFQFILFVEGMSLKNRDRLGHQPNLSMSTK